MIDNNDTPSYDYRHGFGRPRKGAEAMHRKVRGFFYVLTVMVGGVWDSLRTCRFLFSVYQPNTSSAAPSLVASVGGLKPAEKEAIMPNKVKNTPSAFQISNVSIKQDADGRYCLNDLHRASGGLQKHQPRYWLAGVQARELIHELKSDSGIPLSVIKGGSGCQGTYVTKELVYAYAMWISPKFHLAVIRAYDALQTSNSAQKPEVPANTIDMSLRLPFGERRYLIDCGNDRMNMLPLADDVVVMTPQQIKQNLPDILPGYYLVDHKEYAKFMTVRGFCEKLLLEDYDDLIG